MLQFLILHYLEAQGDMVPPSQSAYNFYLFKQLFPIG